METEREPARFGVKGSCSSNAKAFTRDPYIYWINQARGEPWAVHGTAVPQTGGAQSRFVDQMQRQTRPDAIGPLRGPRADSEC